jgi:hypothetical protein
MHRFRTLLMVVCAVAAVTLATSVWATPVPDWLTASEISTALSLPDGSRVTLHMEDIVKIRADLNYIVLAEPFHAQRDRLICLMPVNEALRLGMPVDVFGKLVTIRRGVRALADVTILGYTSQSGELLRHPPLVKWFPDGLSTSWPWKVDLTVSDSTSGMASRLSVTSNEPNADPAQGPTYYPRIGNTDSAVRQTRGVRTQSYYDDIPDLEGLDPGSLVELQCKRIIGVGTEQIGGTTYKYLDVAEDPPAQDWIRCYHDSGAPTTSQRVLRLTGQVRYTNGGSTEVICIDDGPGYNTQLLEGRLDLVDANTIGFVRTQANGATASLAGKVVTASSTDFPGAMYIQEPSGSGYFGGIRVRYAGGGIARGSLVDVTGTVALADDWEREIVDAQVSSNGQDAVSFQGLPNKHLGGGDYNVYTPGVNYPTESGVGVYNKGSLVKTWGKVTGIDAEAKCFYIDDGAQLNDGSGLIGVRVTWDWPGKSAIAPPEQGAYVGVVGISGSVNLGNNHIARCIRIRDQDDLTSYADAPYSCECDRGLPDTNLNNSAGESRCNIRWANSDGNIGVGDDFSLQTGNWIIDGIRVWVVPQVSMWPTYSLGDHFESIALYVGAPGGSLTQLSGGTFTPGTSSTDNPNISFVRVKYQNQNEKDYQAADGAYSQVWQVDFSNLNWAVTGGTSYAFGVHAVPRVDRQLFLHATHWTSQGDGLIRRFDVGNLSAGSSTASGSGWFGGKGSDINVQVFAHAAQ